MIENCDDQFGNNKSIIKLKMHYSFKSTPTWTMKGRSETITAVNQPKSRPGPSDYEVKKPLPKAATISQTTQQRNLWKPFQPNPGPGSYEPKSYITDGVKRSMSAKNVDYVKRTPGPHEYDNNTLKVKNKAPGFSMSTKSKSYREIVKDNNLYKPAPVSYQAKGSFQKSHGVFIGSSHRKDLTETQRTPGPNYYNSEKADMYASTTNPRCRIGGQFRKTTGFMKVQVTPGPAFYEKKGNFDDNKEKSRGFSCRQKTANLIALEISKYPGPGQYQQHTNNKNKAPRCAQTHTARKTFMDDMQDFKKPYPGPGVHQPGFNSSKYRSMSAAPIGRSNRRPLDENQKTPGPVEYRNDKLSVMNAAPKFSVTKTIAKNQFLAVESENPGPGSHDPNLSLVKEKSRNYQVGKERRPDFEKEKYTPGPGFYNLRGKQEGPTWKFSTEKRVAFTDHKNEAKDGQHYEIAAKVVDPPKYMNVEDKVKYNHSKSTFYSTLNSANRSPVKNRG